MKLLLMMMSSVVFDFKSALQHELTVVEEGEPVDSACGTYGVEEEGFCTSHELIVADVISLSAGRVHGTPVRVEFGDATTAADPTGANAIAQSFPHTYGQPLAHFFREKSKTANAQTINEHLRAHCLDFWVVLKVYLLRRPDVLATYKNQGGYDLLGRTKDQIKTTEQVNSAMAACKALNLDGLDIVGGVTSNTDTAQLAETFTEAKCATMKASHIAMECTLQSHPNMLPIPTHPALLPDLIVGLDRCLQYYTSKAKSGCGSRNTFISAMLALPRCAAYTKFHGVFRKKEKPANLQRRNSQTFQTVYQRSLNSPWCMIRRDSKTMVLLVLLAGSPSHAFTLQDSRQIEDDFKSLRDLFWANDISPEPMAAASLGQVYRGGTNPLEGAPLGMSLLECFAEARAYRDMLEGVFGHGVKIDSFEQDREHMLPSCRKCSSNVISNNLCYLDLPDGRPFNVELKSISTLEMTMDQIRTTEQVNSAMAACKALNLDGLDIVREILRISSLKPMLVLILYASNVCTDAFSAEKYYFIRIMGRKASHVAVECTLQSHPNMVILAEEVASSKL
nr:pyrophosphate--fructose 6-phosphate 1-phosphotransferase subunit alpha [Tanacetum cinerariifolium]